ncbi:MAG: hypothetical protein K6U89_08820 [Chloroflexi bacterium]|nr:hypothetical protein [Chloroflexota bacterium]
MGDYEYTHCLDLSALPEIDGRLVRVLWSDAWYDGPLSGMAEVNGEQLYFDFHRADSATRIFVLYRLTPEQHAYELSWRQREEEAGGYTLFDESGYQGWAPERYEGARLEYLARREQEHRPLELRQAEPVGWFSDRGNRAFAGLQVHLGSD